MKVRKAVITAAGYGTRFLPVTRSQPKEMLPLVNKPVIQYSVEEAVNSGIEHIIMVTAMGKRAIEDYFDRSFELEYFLERKGQQALLRQMQDLSTLMDVCYVRQKEQLGLGHAIMTAREVVGEEPFAVMLPDDIIDSQVPCLKSMIQIYEKYGAGVLAVEKVSTADTRKYGVIRPVPVSPGVYQVTELVEKPDPEQAPSRLAIVGRYILNPDIFEALRSTPPGKGGEIQLTDAMQLLLKEQRLYAFEIQGERYDTGNPMGWLKANVAMAIKHDEFGPELRAYLTELLQTAPEKRSAR